MHRLVFIILILFPLMSFSQKGEMTQDRADKITYSLYKYKQWDELIKKGEEFLKDDIDFYYLRVRLGIAYYEIENYRKSVKHLKKAFEFNDPDSLIYEYLYYSYLYSDRKPDANAFYTKYYDILSKRIAITHNLETNSFGFSFGGSLNNNDKKNLNLFENSSERFTRSILYDDNWYLNFNLSQTAFKKLNIYHAYNYINIERNESLWDNGELIYQLPYFIDQHDYFISANYPIASGLSIIGTYQIMNSRFISSDPIILGRDNQSIFPGYVNYLNNIFQVGLNLDFSNFKFISGIVAGEINEDLQKELFASLVYYPFGNKNLYSISSIIYHTNDEADNTIFTQKLGVRFHEKLWMEAEATIGTLINYVEPLSFLTYNIPDNITFKGGANLYYPLTDKITFSIYYKFYQREDFYFTYELPQNYILGENIYSHKFEYQTHSLTGGIEWTF
jgi:tetratricopeptide (TPR) repeat protein